MRARRLRLKLDQFQDFDFRRYFEHAAWQSLAEFEKWVGVATSPIGVFSDFSSSQNWLPVASRMLKLAQRLVAGLLLSWRPAERWDSRTQAEVPGKARWISAGGDQSLYAVNDSGQLYQSRSPSASGRSWVLRLAGMDGLRSSSRLTRRGRSR